jgi:NADH-quinone oxidoreductase subunit A
VENLLLLPPIAFLVVLALVVIESRGLAPFAIKPAQNPPGKFKAYACGEDVADHKTQPDYRQFFHFAYFFTIMHVVALVVTTVPPGSVASAVLAVLFLVAAAVGLYVLFRR